MSNNLQIGIGSFRILDKRALEIGQPGLTLWTQAGQAALLAHRREMAEAAAAAAEAKAILDEITAHARKADIFTAIEKANRALAGTIERLALCGLLVVLLSVSLADDSDDLARRAGRGRSGRRRDDMVALTDGETGEAA